MDPSIETSPGLNAVVSEVQRIVGERIRLFSNVTVRISM